MVFGSVRLNREHFESPESLRSKASLRASSFALLTPAVLASAVFPERLAPFSPAQRRLLGLPMGGAFKTFSFQSNQSEQYPGLA
jgi:hypothetical protein